MFTGIVEELGQIAWRDGGRLRIQASIVVQDAVLGASIAVNGCCLTVVAQGQDADGPWWEADLSDETLARTNLGALDAGARVNLERPVRLDDRLGGHLVQGHVDAVGTIVRPVPDLQIRMPAELLRYVVEKGSITVDGISLTVVEPLDDGFTVAVIPHTAEVTTLGTKTIGDTVNLEVDVMAKYAERLLGGFLPSGTAADTSIPAVDAPAAPSRPRPEPPAPSASEPTTASASAPRAEAH